MKTYTQEIQKFQIILEWDGELYEIAQLHHPDIASTSFLRTWTMMAWEFYFEFIKQHKLRGDANPRFNNFEQRSDFEVFTPPLNATVSDAIEDHELAIYVTPWNEQLQSKIKPTSAIPS